MSYVSRSILFLFSLALLVSCNSASKQKHKLIHEAEDLAAEAQIEYQRLLANLDQKRTTADSTDVKGLNQILERLKNWKTNMGMVVSDEAHDHDHEGHDHDHDHSHGSSGIQLTEQDRVIVIKEFIDSLDQIEMDLSKFK